MRGVWQGGHGHGAAHVPFLRLPAARLPRTPRRQGGGVVAHRSRRPRRGRPRSPRSSRHRRIEEATTGVTPCVVAADPDQPSSTADAVAPGRFRWRYGFGGRRQDQWFRRTGRRWRRFRSCGRVGSRLGRAGRSWSGLVQLRRWFRVRQPIGRVGLLVLTAAVEEPLPELFLRQLRLATGRGVKLADPREQVRLRHNSPGCPATACVLGFDSGDTTLQGTKHCYPPAG
jgi:hypothetical protein